MAFAVGAAVGAAVALLFAPATGGETRVFGRACPRGTGPRCRGRATGSRHGQSQPRDVDHRIRSRARSVPGGDA